MSKTFDDLLWGVKGLWGLPSVSEKETYTRLSRVAKRSPRYTPGRFRFAFGELQYMDALALKYQYREIFIEGGYDFTCTHEAPLILDCGGNIGLSAVWFKQRYPKSRVRVFEADPSIAEVLKANVARLNLTSVEIVPVAVWSHTGTVLFAADRSDAGHVSERAGDREVRAERLADWITEPVDLLKLDIEGAEYRVISDLHEAEKLPLVKRLICEIHSRREDRREVVDLLSALTQDGYEVTFNYARSAPDLPGEAEPTPFPAAPDGKCLLRLYAWRC